jgi:hypothetical protein
MFSPEIWSRISALLTQALDLEPPMRNGWLDALPPEYADLRETLRELLLADDGEAMRDLFPSLAQLDGIAQLLRLELSPNASHMQLDMSSRRSDGIDHSGDRHQCGAGLLWRNARTCTARLAHTRGVQHPDTLEVRKH